MGKCPEIRKIEGRWTVGNFCPRNCFCEKIIAYKGYVDKSNVKVEKDKNNETVKAAVSFGKLELFTSWEALFYSVHM